MLMGLCLLDLYVFTCITLQLLETVLFRLCDACELYFAIADPVNIHDLDSPSHRIVPPACVKIPGSILNLRTLDVDFVKQHSYICLHFSVSFSFPFLTQ